VRKLNQFHCTLTAALFCIIGATSCSNNVGDVPFPARYGYMQPLSKPLVFSAPKPMLWATAKTGAIKPVSRPLDLNTLPSYTYDSTGFKPFAQAPVAARFNMEGLPDTAFNINALQSQPLAGKTGLMGMPEMVTAGAPLPKNGTPLSMSDFGVKQGLPARIIAAMLTDRHGLTWLAGDGLYRYDGEHIQTFYPSRSAQPIVGMVEDNDGKIWCTSNFGLLTIDVAKGTMTVFEQFIFPANDLAKLFKDEKGRIWALNNKMGGILVIDPATQTYKHITAGVTGTTFGIAKDSSSNIWISTKFNGINIINLSTGRIKRFTHSNGLASDTLSGMGVDGSGRVWVGVAGNSSNSGYDIFDVKQGTITHLGAQQGFKPIFCLSVLPEKDGEMWLGSFDHIDVINLQQQTHKNITTAQGLSNQSAISLFRDAGNRVWAGTSRGLNIIDQNAKLVKPLGTAAIVTLMEDAASNIWAGTYTGIKILDPQKKVVHILDKQHGLGHNFVQSFAEDGGKIWVTTNGGLDVIDRASKTIQHTGVGEGLTTDTIYAVLKDNQNNLWLTGPTQGVQYVDLQHNVIKQASIKQGLSDAGIADIKQDAQGNIWLATVKGGVDVINMADSTIRYLTDAPGLRDTCYRILLPDKAGRMWIGTYKGIYVVDLKANTFTEITTANGLAGNKIISLLEHDGKIYAATDKSVSIITAPQHINGDTPQNRWLIQPLDQSGGLTKEVPSSWSTNAIGKKGQYLWGDSGITIIHTLAPNLTTPPPAFVTGIKIINEPGQFTNRLKLAEKDTLFAVDTFYTTGQSPVTNHIPGLNWDSVAGPYNIPVHLNIPYNANYLQFQFTQAHTSNTSAPVYSYILEGIDKQWSAITGNAFSENYLNLPPGDYTFKVRAKSASTNWSKPASLSFTISPPWWKTWWAYTLYIIISMYSVATFVRYRSRRLVAEKTVLEEKVRERTIALQKSLEDLQVTQKQLVQSEKMASLGELTAGIAHEIQNPLNFVNNFAEVSVELAEELKEELGKLAMDEDTKENVDAIIDDLVQNQQKINFHGKRADSIVKGMLQHSRTGSGHKEPTDINVLADEYLRLSYHGLRAKDKTFNAKLETSFDESLPKISVLAQEIGRVLLNLYTNAFYSVMKKKKTGVENYQPVVSVSTQKVGDAVEIRVKDNGLGIPESVLEKIYNPFFTTKPTGEGTGLGLSLSYEIVTKAHNGTIHAETKEGEFAEFIIRLPLH